MPIPLALILLAERLPGSVPGRVLHRAGLATLAGGDAALALRAFAAAGLAYRREVEVERLARLRVHELIARFRLEAAGRDELELEVERRLCRLGAIESLEPPFELVDAGRLLAVWSAPAGAPRGPAALTPERAAA